MQLLRNYPIFRTVALILIVAALICATIVLAWRGINLEQTEQQSLRTELALSRTAQQLKFRAADLSARQTAYAFDVLRGAGTAIAEASRSRRAFLAAAAAFDRTLKEMQAFNLARAERAQLQAAEQAYREFLKIDALIVAAYRRGGSVDKERANALVTGQEMDLLTRMVAHIDSVERSAGTRAAQASERADRAARRARNAFTGAGALALALVALLAWVTAATLRRNSRLLQQLRGEAHTDGLTGIANRRAWDERLARELEQSRRLRYPVALALIDLDFFKKYNDQHGHPAGDRLLQEAATGFRGALRQGDLLARYGGEEFGLLLPGCQLAEAYAKVEQLRPLTPAQQTFSAGVAQWDGREAPAALVRRADQALYEAKRRGRNRTMGSPGPEPVDAAADEPVVSGT